MVERSIRIRDAPGSIPGVSTSFEGNRQKYFGLVRELNPGPLAPEARIIPLDQQASQSEKVKDLTAVGFEPTPRKTGA